MFYLLHTKTNVIGSDLHEDGIILASNGKCATNSQSIGVVGYNGDVEPVWAIAGHLSSTIMIRNFSAKIRQYKANEENSYMTIHEWIL